MKSKKISFVNLLLALLLIFTIVGSNVQPSYAASKLTKEDFKSYGTYGCNFIKEATYDDTFFTYANLIYETDPPKSILRTKRGIKLNDTKTTVFKKYGKTTLKKVNYKTDKFCRAVRSIGHDVSAELIKKLSKYADYIYKYGKNEYRLRFYFDKKGKVKTIAYFKNYNRL